jgi:alkyl sulfatase BDS1-like metallo-beta-lactamase superfamily hydrolase
MKRWILATALAGALTLAGTAGAQAPKATTDTKTTAKKSTGAAATTPPTDQEIADAKTKGLVWVNTTTKVYHKDGQYYGKTKRGKFMSEDDAKKGGFKLAQEPAAKKTKATTK